MSKQFVARSILADWQVAPAEHEIANYDKPKLEYRKQVEEFVKGVKNLTNSKRAFFTISTNVRCAILKTSNKDLDPVDRDIYLPLEITIVKWTLRDARCPLEIRKLSVKHYMLNPGYERDNKSNCAILEHDKLHKIRFRHRVDDDRDYIPDPEDNPFIMDPSQVVKDINSFLTQDRTVFSLSLKYCRQDLGSLKWLNQVCGYSFKPIKVFSLEDLYVVMIRSIMKIKQPDAPETITRLIGQGVARYKLSSSDLDALDPEIQCEYHRLNAEEDSSQECRFCSRAISLAATNILLNDLVCIGELYTEEQIDEYVEQIKKDGLMPQSSDEVTMGAETAFAKLSLADGSQ